MAWPESVDKSQIKIEFFRGQGPGGQHRNKTDSACRMTHIPTGISAMAQDQRSQHQNRRVAFKRLADKLIPIMKAKLALEKAGVNRERIRTYHEKRGTVVDHRVPDKVFNLKSVLDGDLDPIISAVVRKKSEDTAP